MSNPTRRNTHQRQLVLDIVRADHSHPTAVEIYDQAREQDPTISKGTVYRNLNLLADMGEIRRLQMPFGADHYDYELKGHYHFICRCCNKVVDANLEYMDNLNEANAGLPGYNTEWHRLLLVGLCPECNQKIKEENRQ